MRALVTGINQITAALIDAVRARAIGNYDTILLNITGGGETKFFETHEKYEVDPVFVSKSISDKDLGALLWTTLKKSF